MTRPMRLTDPLPLRTTADIGEYTESAVLPLLYGATRISPVSYDSSGHLWLVADHIIAGIDRVEFQGREITTWQLQQDIDSTGHPVAVLETGAQIENRTDLRITARGALHPGTGEPLDRPDLILWHLAHLAGYDLDPARLDDLRASCQTAGLHVGGIIDTPDITIQGAIDIMVRGSGLAWSREAAGVAFFWPRSPQDPVITVDSNISPDLTARWSGRDLFTELQLAYDYDWAVRDYRSTITMHAPAAIEIHGRRNHRIEAGWLHDSRAAIAHAVRYLQHHARQQWEISAVTARAAAAVGATVNIDHPYAPVSEAICIERSDGAVDSALTLTAAAGDPPAVELIGTAAAVDPDHLTGPIHDYQDGLATWLITDDSQPPQPLPGARVTLDGGQVRYADNRGYVQFPVAPGEHILRIEAAGHDPRTVPVVVS